VLAAVLLRHHGEVAQLGDAGPALLRRRAEQLEDEVELLELVAAGQDGLAQQQLGQDAAGGPEVDGGPVLRGAEEQLRRPVPEGDDPVGVLLVLVVKRPRQTEIGELELTRLVDEKVGAL